ncbi:MAG: hypothetical protein SOZ34_05535 [Clostridia bacterium]|nr:hypothetical protein [Clostridia bacterium]
MNKILKTGAVIISAIICLTSSGIAAIAENEQTQKILLYEDMENITLANDFDFTTNRTWVYFNTIDSFTKPYIYGYRDYYSTNQEIEIKAQPNGNRTFNLKNTSTETKASNDGNIAKLWMRFDNSYGLDKTSTDRLVIAYDISAEKLYSEAGESIFFGMPFCSNEDTSFIAMENEVHAAGLMRMSKDESGNIDKTKLTYSIRNTNGAAEDNGNSTNAKDVAFGDTVRIIQIINNYKKDLPEYDVIMHYPGSDPARSPVSYIFSQGTITNIPTSVNGVMFVGQMGMEYGVDNIKAYTLPENKTFAVTSTDLEELPVTSSLDVTLNGYVPETQLSKIIVKKGDEVVDSSNYTISVKENTETVESKISVKANGKLDFGTTYSVILPSNFMDETYTTLDTETTVNFTTQAAPSFDLTLSASSGGKTITSLAEAAGKSVLCDVDVTHTTARNSYGTIFVGLYDAEGNVVAYGCTDKTYAPEETDTVQVKLSIPADTSGMCIKAFGCEGISKLDSIFSSVQILQ